MSSAISIPRWRFLGILLAALVLVLPAAAREALGVGDGKECPPSSEVTPLATETGSAGYVSNILNRAGSIRAISNRMLGRALDSARSNEPPQWVVFTSTPELSKQSGGDDEICAHHEQVTKKDPIKFEDRHFESAEELTDWIMDFTQGKGAEGESLYQQCPGKCSPRYTWLIEPVKSGMNVKTRIVCGLPRDRGGNKYNLTTELTRACSVEEKQGAANTTQ